MGHKHCVSGFCKPQPSSAKSCTRLSLTLVWRLCQGLAGSRQENRAGETTTEKHDATRGSRLIVAEEGAHLDNRYQATSVRKVMKSISHPYSTIHSCI